MSTKQSNSLNLSCFECHKNFIFKESSSTNVLPLLLNCGHNFCLKCVKSSVDSQSSAVICPSCKHSTPVEDKHNLSNKSFNLNYYLLGYILSNNKHYHENDYQSFSGKKKYWKEIVTPSKDLCQECNSYAAQCSCVKCDSFLCYTCFDKIHNVSKTLKKHKSVPIAPLSRNSSAEEPSFNMCKAHNREIEYYCEDDELPICSRCFIVGGHKDHQISLIDDKNKEIVQNLESKLDLASLTIKRLKHADKTLTSCQPLLETELSSALALVNKQFLHLHGLLQIKEVLLAERVTSMFKKNIDSLNEMRLNVLDELNKLELAVKDSLKLISNIDSATNIDVQQISTYLLQAPSVPCFVEKNENVKTSVQVNPNFEKLDDLVDKIFHLSNSENRFTLRKADYYSYEQQSLMDAQMVDDGTLPTLSRAPSSASSISQTDISKKSNTSEVETADTESVTSVSTQSSIASYSSISKAQFKRTKFKESEINLVRVTHIKNPCNFMVQREEDIKLFHAEAVEINRFCESERATVPRTLEEGSPCFGKYALDNQWYRARVKKVIKKANIPDCLELLYIDYGNSECVPYNRVKKMESHFLKTPELAINCSLVNITPSHESGKWTKEVCQEFINLTGDLSMEMKIINEVDGVFYVDLAHPANEDVMDDRPVSLRDALVFLDCASFKSEFSMPDPFGSLPKPRRRYIKPEQLRANQSLSAVICSVESPDKFYIQKDDENSVYLCNLMDQLQQVYSESGVHHYQLYCPQINEICVCQFDIDRKWYRAEVLSLLGRRTARVRYVDYGNEQVVSQYNLKKILDRFLAVPVQALPCALFGVEPKEAGWTSQVTDTLNSLSQSSFHVKIKDVIEGVAHVTLYDSSQRPPINVNRQFVSEGLAVWADKSVNVSDDLISSSSDQIKRKVDVNKPTKTKAKSTSRKTKMAAGLEGLKDDSTNLEHVNAVTNQTQLEEKPSRYEVIVTHLNNPSNFHVQLKSAGEDGLSNMMLLMNQTYENSTAEKIDWNVDDICAIKNPADLNWYRGKIENKVNEETFEVYLIDFGLNIVGDCKDIRVLSGGFTDHGRFSLKCHLKNVQPAGGTKWSQTSCEAINEILKDKTLFLVINDEEEPTNGSQPVDLIFEETIQGDALNVDKIEIRNIARMLMEKGLALPVKSMPKCKGKTQLDSGSTTVTQPPFVGFLKNRSMNNTEENKNFENSQKIISQTADSRLVSPKFSHGRLLKRSVSENIEFSYRPSLIKNSIYDIVPTYVDYDMGIYGHVVEKDEDETGQSGYLLRETTLEALIQDSYLEQYGLKRSRVPRDGNCLFAAFSAAHLGDPSHHADVRRNAVSSLGVHWTELSLDSGLKEQDYDHYVAEMVRDGTHGGEPEIRALSRYYNVSIRLHVGGLSIPPQTIEYDGNLMTSSQTKADLETVDLVYMADDKEFSNGHYDAAVSSKHREATLDCTMQFYNEWRKERIKTLTFEKDKNNFDNSILHQLMNFLSDKYDDSEPEVDTQLNIGQSVIAQYPLDDKFYRARVDSFEENKIKVFFVDFGNFETVSRDKIRSNITLPEIPIVSYMFVLNDIFPKTPDGKWPVKVLDYVHKLIVSKMAKVEILETVGTGKPVPVKFTLENGTDLRQELMEFGIAQTSSEKAQSSIMIRNTLPVQAFKPQPPSQQNQQSANTDTPSIVFPSEDVRFSEFERSLNIRLNSPLASPQQSVPCKEEKSSPKTYNQMEDQNSQHETVNLLNSSVSSDTSVANENSVFATSSLTDSESEILKLKLMQEIQNYKSPYKAFPLLRKNYLMLVCITQVDSSNLVAIQHIRVEDAQEKDSLMVKNFLDQLSLFSDELKESYSTYAPLQKDKIKQGTPCIAQYSLDHNWYRAEIVTLLNDRSLNKVGVLFVDYGNFDFVSFDCLKQIPQDMLQLPKQAQRCILHGIAPTDETNQDEAIHGLMELISGKILVCSIRAIEPEVYIDLYDYDPSEMEPTETPLVYQHLIDSGLVTRTSTSSETDVDIEISDDEMSSSQDSVD